MDMCAISDNNAIEEAMVLSLPNCGARAFSSISSSPVYYSVGVLLYDATLETQTRLGSLLIADDHELPLGCYGRNSRTGWLSCSRSIVSY